MKDWIENEEDSGYVLIVHAVMSIICKWKTGKHEVGC